MSEIDWTQFSVEEREAYAAASEQQPGETTTAHQTRSQLLLGKYNAVSDQRSGVVPAV